jgi:hypothetical protein
MDWHNFLCNKLAISIFILNQAKNFLTPKALKTLYFSLVHPHLLYCINIYSCTSQANLNRMYKLQKKAIRIISNANSSAHTEPLFHSLGILPLNQLIKQAKLHLMHSTMGDKKKGASKEKICFTNSPISLELFIQF